MNTIDIARDTLSAYGVEFRTETGTDAFGTAWTALVVPGKVRFYSQDEEAHLAASLLDDRDIATGALLQASGTTAAVAALADLVVKQWAR